VTHPNLQFSCLARVLSELLINLKDLNFFLLSSIPVHFLALANAKRQPLLDALTESWKAEKISSKSWETKTRNLQIVRKCNILL
jgi:hypothetical protein